ncbi:hypothetical protein MJT46_004676 [Ovis ammon polii x Ovis aries]|nr:hypothetical protein MJT46_004676 [Ovis ammon polii x Ovis aries]
MRREIRPLQSRCLRGLHCRTLRLARFGLTREAEGLQDNWKELLPSLMGENEALYWPLSEKLKISLFSASVPNPMTLISRYGRHEEFNSFLKSLYHYLFQRLQPKDLLTQRETSEDMRVQEPDLQPTVLKKASPIFVTGCPPWFCLIKAQTFIPSYQKYSLDLPFQSYGILVPKPECIWTVLMTKAMMALG